MKDPSIPAVGSRLGRSSVKRTSFFVQEFGLGTLRNVPSDTSPLKGKVPVASLDGAQTEQGAFGRAWRGFVLGVWGKSGVFFDIFGFLDFFSGFSSDLGFCFFQCAYFRCLFSWLCLFEDLVHVDFLFKQFPHFL